MKRIKTSLTAKIFLLTALLLLMISGLTYACVAAFLPSTYKNALEEDLQRVSEELSEELEHYQSIEEAENFLEFFEANNQATVVLLDAEGNQVFPRMEIAEEAFLEEAAEKTLVGESDAVMEEDFEEEKDVTQESGESLVIEGQETGESFPVEYDPDISGVILSEMITSLDTSGIQGISYVSQEVSSNSAVQSYQTRIGETQYTMLVTGTMQAVNQAMKILREILPMIMAVIAVAALICAFLASFYLIRPIVRLSRVSRKMASLQFEEKCRENRSDEIGVLSESLNELSENLSGALSELREANQKLKSDIEREREEERKRTAFFAAASHELKTPVTVLKGHLGGMLKNVGAYKNRDYYLKRSCQVTETMESMVKEILSISRMESGAWELQKERLDLAELVRLEAAEMIELLEEKRLGLSVEVPEHLYCQGDRAMLVKVLRNFLMNAIRYSPEGAGVKLFMRELSGKVLFSVENTGTRIPEEAIPHLFEAFYRVDDSRNRQSGGSGLGLYIVRMILEQHGAAYGVENTERGVRFWFRMDET